MKAIFNNANVIGGTIGGFVSFILGGWDALAKALIVFMILDYMTGLMAAAYSGTLCSVKGFKGIIKKSAILLTVCMASVMQVYLMIPVRDIVVTFFIVNEGLSIVENIGKVVELPDIITKSLLVLKGEHKNNG